MNAVGYDGAMAATLVQQPSVTAELTAVDRCDRCGAQAYVRARLRSTGSELLFCAHHGREHLPRLADVAEIHDERSKLEKENDAFKGTEVLGD